MMIAEAMTTDMDNFIQKAEFTVPLRHTHNYCQNQECKNICNHSSAKL